jgi:hypothetical protein
MTLRVSPAYAQRDKVLLKGGQAKLAILYVVVVSAILVWWFRSIKPKRRI